MTKTYTDLRKQISALQAQADELYVQERAGVIGRIKEAIDLYGLGAADLGLRAGSKATSRRAVRTSATRGATAGAKFANGLGQTWGGRGPRPAWLREALAGGHTLEEFAVDSQHAKAALLLGAAQVPVSLASVDAPATAVKTPKQNRKTATTSPRTSATKKTTPATRRQAASRVSAAAIEGAGAGSV